MTLGSVLVQTSYPLRTSPVLRGKWVLEEILGAPTPPPPPNVGTAAPPTMRPGRARRSAIAWRSIARTRPAPPAPAVAWTR